MKTMLHRTACLTALGAGAWLATRTALRRHRHWSLRDRVVLITGGSRGLGLVMARQAVAEGARVAICSRDPTELARALDELRAGGARVLGDRCDVSDEGQVKRLAATVRKELGPVEVLINNAGIIQVGPRSTQTRDDFEQALDVHLWGCFHTVAAVLPEMLSRGGGRIVNISSIGGMVAVPHLAAYSTSKHALVGFSRGLRSELARDGVYVTTVCPGLMRTGGHRNALFKGRHRQEYAWFSAGASAPLIAMSAERAARKILTACRQGRADVTLSLPARLLATLQAVAPELTAELLACEARLLPATGGIGDRSAVGHASRLGWPQDWVNVLGENAARRNNELPNGKVE